MTAPAPPASQTPTSTTAPAEPAVEETPVPGLGNGLGGRLPLAHRSALSPPQQRLFDRVADEVVPWATERGLVSQDDDGRLIGPFNPLLHSPGIGGHFLTFNSAANGALSLAPRVREVVILAVGAVWESAYELYAHMAAGQAAGLPAEAAAALAAGQPPAELSPDERCAWEFARQLTVDRRVGRLVYDRACAAFGTRGVTALVLLIGAYQTVCGILNAFEIPAPEVPPQKRSPQK